MERQLIEQNKYNKVFTVLNCSKSLYGGPVSGGAHVPRLNFTASYVAISLAHCHSDIPICWNNTNRRYGLYL